MNFAETMGVSNPWNHWRRRRRLPLTFSLAQLRNGNARQRSIFRDLDNGHCQQHCTGNSKKHLHSGPSARIKTQGPTIRHNRPVHKSHRGKDPNRWPITNGQLNEPVGRHDEKSDQASGGHRFRIFCPLSGLMRFIASANCLRAFSVAGRPSCRLWPTSRVVEICAPPHRADGRSPSPLSADGRR